MPCRRKGNRVRSLQEIGESLHQRGIFTGGPIEYFERMGRMQFSLMVREGIYPWSKVLDIGCGCLRGGYWMVHFLNPDCYCGIEPNVSMVNVGLSEIIEPEVLIAKRPRIDHNAVFDSSVFGVTFDAFLARSIWTHASKAMIATMLDNFVRDSSSRAFFLTSYLPARWPWEDYKGTAHIGRSHVSKIPGLVKHSRRWIKSECEARGLSVRELSDGILMDQKWLKICRLPSESPVYPYRSGRRVED
jgi:hypothetical protein